ncbi:MAG: caspase family protein [Bacteroidetes bacterium]|nr:caspase family protein [Bacteroidota bacterium]MDF1866037.1 caspase family protein [Saprospiraceae bacterium]
MKTIFAILITILTVQISFAQCPISFYDLETLIPRERDVALERWAEKGEYEPTTDYQNRLQNQYELKKVAFGDSILNIYKERYKRSLPSLEFSLLGDYDADRQVFEGEINCFNSFFLQVPKEEARVFASDKRKKVKAIDLGVSNNDWSLTEVEVFSPKLKKSFYYYTKQIIEYIPQETFGTYAEVTQNEPEPPVSKVVFEEPDYPMPDGIYNIHTNLPKTQNENDNAIAIIITNQNYSIANDVKYAIQDGKTIKKYLIETIGYNEDNILVFEDLKRIDFVKIFGNYETHTGKLFNKAQDGERDIFIYYAGHGAPGLNNKNAYFLPVNCDPSQAEFDGYSLDLLLMNLAKIPAKSKTMVVDACFSGINIQGISGVSKIGIRKKINKYDDGKTIVLTSSEEDQYSSWYPAKEHGLFTYFFLKAIHDKEHSDQNQDGLLTYQEIFEYVSDKNNGVPHCAGVILEGLVQRPEVVLGESLLHKEFIRYK